MADEVDLKIDEADADAAFARVVNSDVYASLTDAMDEAFSTADNDGNKHIWLPHGVINVQPNELSDFALTNRVGLHFQGAGRRSTILKLITGGSEAWMCDNGSGATNRKLSFPTFTDIGFQSDSTEFGNGFRLHSEGHEKKFMFTRCWFGEFSTMFRVDGLLGNDSHKFIGCEIMKIHDAVFEWNNPNAMIIEFHATNIEQIYGDVFRVISGGGGELRWYGGSLIMFDPGDATMRYLLRLEPTDDTSVARDQFIIHGIKAELRSEYNGLVHALGRDGSVVVPFQACNFISGAISGDREAVVIGQGRRVTFTECGIPSELLYTLDVDNAHAGTTAGITALLEFEKCRIPDELSAKISRTSAYGRVIARGCSTSGVPAERSSVDFDQGWNRAREGEPAVELKRTTLKHTGQFWPYDGGNEKTVKLPVDAVITRILCVKTSGSGATDYQLHVGNDDKSTIYAESTTAAQSTEHRAIADDLFVAVGSTDNERIVRMWATNTGGTNHAPGYAMVEYM